MQITVEVYHFKARKKVFLESERFLATEDIFYILYSDVCKTAKCKCIFFIIDASND